jgi:hypothetical protein
MNKLYKIGDLMIFRLSMTSCDALYSANIVKSTSQNNHLHTAARPLEK